MARPTILSVLTPLISGPTRIRESAIKNRSPEIDHMVSVIAGPGAVPQNPHAPGIPYCAVGACYVDEEFRRHNPGALGEVWGLKTAGSQDIKRWAHSRGKLFEDPQHLLKCEGFLFGFTLPHDPDHGHVGVGTGRLTSGERNDLKVLLINTGEFNTNLAGSRDGEGAYANVRDVPVSNGHNLWYVDMTGFQGWNYLEVRS